MKLLPYEILLHIGAFGDIDCRRALGILPQRMVRLPRLEWPPIQNGRVKLKISNRLLGMHGYDILGTDRILVWCEVGLDDPFGLGYRFHRISW